MMQNDIDAIYDHLHEYFKYENGDLVAIKTSRGKVPVGRSIGSFNHNRTAGSPLILCSLTVNKKRYSIQLKNLIYIFHYKIKPKNILFRDNNPTNCKIENLIPVDTLNKFILQKENYANKSGATPYTHNGNTRYRVRLSTDEGRFTIGSYSDEKTAIKCYEFAKKLYMKKNLSNDEIKRLSIEKYPSNQHKKVKLKGVSQVKGNRFVKVRYKALYSKDGLRKHIGTYDTEIEAHEAYLEFKGRIENI